MVSLANSSTSTICGGRVCGGQGIIDGVFALMKTWREAGDMRGLEVR